MVDKMDRKQDWKWLPSQMPTVAKMLSDKKSELGAEWVNTCWRRGVVEGQPGWFFAAERALAVGTPWADAPGVDVWLGLRQAQQLQPCLLVLREKEGGDGA